jgi:hypothetical protein
MIFFTIDEELLEARKTKFNKEAHELEKDTAENTIKVLSVLKAAIQKDVIDKKIDRAFPSDEICISHIKKHLNQAKENRDLAKKQNEGKLDTSSLFADSIFAIDLLMGLLPPSIDSLKVEEIFNENKDKVKNIGQIIPIIKKYCAENNLYADMDVIKSIVK